MLKNIEQHTRQKIRIEPVPSVLDLRARQLEATQSAVRQAIEDGALDKYRAIVESLGEEFDVIDIGAAAVKLVHEASGKGGDGEEEIAVVQPPREQFGRLREKTSKSSANAGKDSRPHPQKTGKMVRVHIALGRKSGVRPADLVGAIANEAGISGKDIGSIEMGNGFALVEIPESDVDAVVEAMSTAKIRGQRVSVKRDRAPARYSPKHSRRR